MTEMLGGIVQGEVERANDTWSLVTSPRLLITGKVPSRFREFCNSIMVTR